MLDSNTIVRYQGNKREIRLPLVTKNSERIEFLFEEEIFWKNEMADMSQINMKEMTRKYGEEEVIRLMNEIILKLQKQILGVEEMAKEKRRQREKEQRERQKEEEETDRWMKECYKRNEKERKEREEKKEQKRVKEK